MRENRRYNRRYIRKDLLAEARRHGFYRPLLFPAGPTLYDAKLHARTQRISLEEAVGQIFGIDVQSFFKRNGVLPWKVHGLDREAEMLTPAQLHAEFADMLPEIERRKEEAAWLEEEKHEAREARQERKAEREAIEEAQRKQHKRDRKMTRRMMRRDPIEDYSSDEQGEASPRPVQRQSTIHEALAKLQGEAEIPATPPSQLAQAVSDEHEADQAAHHASPLLAEALVDTRPTKRRTKDRAGSSERSDGKDSNAPDSRSRSPSEEGSSDQRTQEMLWPLDTEAQPLCDLAPNSQENQGGSAGNPITLV